MPSLQGGWQIWRCDSISQDVSMQFKEENVQAKFNHCEEDREEAGRSASD